MIQLNTFSLIDLLAVFVSGQVLLLFLLRRRKQSSVDRDRLLAVPMLVLFFYSIVVLAADNVVPAGVPARSVPDAAQRTLLIYRLTYVCGTFMMLGLAHLALRYCRGVRLGWRVVWLYLAALLLCRMYWSDSFLRAIDSPRALTSSWRVAVPWQPETGGLIYIFFGLWLGTNIYFQYLFWKRPKDGPQSAAASLTSNVIWIGLSLWGIAGLAGMVSAAFEYAGVDFTTFVIAASMVLLMIGLEEEHVRSERQRELVTRRFQSYVDPALVKYVIEHPEKEHIPGEVREMTVVFTDLDGFTPLSERLREDVVPLLNEYLKAMTPLIREHNGYRNKWIGDGMMFFYGAPEKNPDHAIHAVSTVLKMQEMMLKFNEGIEGRSKELGGNLLPLAMRTGVSTGRMIVGDAGPGDASDYTAIGDAVNLGARLESANKAMGTRILLSAQTVEHLPAELFLIRPIGRLKVVGLTDAVMAYEPLALADHATESQRRCAELSRAMVECFARADFDGCLKAEEDLLRDVGASKFGEVYRQLCDRYLREPPEGRFAGEIILATK